MDANNPWMMTVTGRQFHFLNPRPEDISIIDIAHGLAYQPRWMGMLREFLSVAQHCVILSYLVPAEIAKVALFHDAHEAYLGDMSRGLKEFSELGREYRMLSSRIQYAIQTQFDVPTLTIPEEIILHDLDMRYSTNECIQFGTDVREIEGMVGAEPLDLKINPWSREFSKHAFLTRFYQLEQGIGLEDQGVFRPEQLSGSPFGL